MPTLSGKLSKRLNEALDDAFDSPEALDEFLFEMLGKRLHNVSADKDLQIRRFQLIRKADAQGWVLDLIAAAGQARPKNAALREVAAEVGLGAASTSLERVILDTVPFLDIAVLRARLGELEAQVCRVEVPAPTRPAAGSGFLIGPDRVLTNYHVVDVLRKGLANPAETRLRFDYRATPDGTRVTEGIIARLAADWLEAWRPPSEADNLSDPGDTVPALDELDFAVLRIEEPLGAQPIGRAENVREAPDRGWINLEQAGPDGFAAGDPLLILQHPSDEPLKVAFGQSDGLNANGTRLRHRVNTKRGSSGSPCLNARLEVVALHHAGDPNFDPAHKPAWNAAVPIAAIRDYLPS